jgi:hypothetical protein
MGTYEQALAKAKGVTPGVKSKDGKIHPGISMDLHIEVGLEAMLEQLYANTKAGFMTVDDYYRVIDEHESILDTYRNKKV